jgi:DNA-binding MarR family transcriptional regulator
MQSTNLAHEVLAAIRQIVRRIAEHSKQLSRDVGLTVPQLMCLKAIAEQDDAKVDTTIGLVSDTVHLSAATVSRIIDRLERAGLVERGRGASDRRRVRLSLTAAGQERSQALPAPLQKRFVERFTALPDEERRTLLTSLRRISELMDASDLDASPILTPEADVRGE